MIILFIFLEVFVFGFINLEGFWLFFYLENVEIVL